MPLHDSVNEQNPVGRVCANEVFARRDTIMRERARVAMLAPYLLSVMRIALALVFIEHGTSKLLGFPPPSHPFHVALSPEGMSGPLELVGGLLLLVGLFTRPVAFILSGEMAVAYFLAHAPRNFFPLLNMGELAVVYCFVFLYLAAAGGGRWSLDRVIAGRRADQDEGVNRADERHAASSAPWRRAA
jgi:putative oxidoreductase